MRRAFFAIVAAAALSPYASSNDTMVTLAAGGLVPVHAEHVVMESENLEISIHGVTVTYNFRNESAKDIDATVAFPLPALNGGAVENEPMSLPSKDPLNFVDFQVTSDGAPVKVNVETLAFDGKKDVTKRLQSVGLPLSLMTVRETKAIEKLTKPQKAALAKEKLIACDDGLDHDCWPAWQMRVQFYWTQHFPAGTTVVLQHMYRPVIGGSYIVASMDGASTVASYCGGAEGIATIAKFKQEHPAKSQDDIVLWENRIEYILTTANNWSGPIRSFHLGVVTDSAEDMMFSCMTGLKRVSPTRFEMERENFRPDKELKVLVLTGKSNFR